MSHRKQNEEGLALLLALITVIVVLGAVMVVTYRVHTAKRMTDEAVLSARVDEVCKAGVDVAVEQLWHQYIITNGNTTGNLASYRVFINNLVPNNEDINGNGTQDAEE